ncbi:MAG: peptide chain release factor 1 [Azoarcus sp.]|jgi:peptide chain release factor 1|nr:peptide chain release factor 1 [Azoarcus sp.]
MKASIRDRLDRLVDRLEELDRELGGETTARDVNRFRDLSRERAEIEPVTALYREWRQAEADCATAREMLDDAEMRELGEAELASGEARLAELEDALQRALLPRDPNDGRNLFLEIRAGTGGEEAALFAADLLRMYTRYAERQRWKVEIVSANESDLGGYREVIARLVGDGAWSRLKFESGGHRVQRVPVTETQGRIHTSACTVAVMPEADELEAQEIDPADLRIDTFRASGAGGQHINKTDSAVRITHLPSGLVVECQAERSQHSNKARALAVLAARLYDARVRERQAAEAATRRGLIGSGDRSERIRTYNFPQGRVTDHRINLTLYRLDAVMDGDLDEILAALAFEHQAGQLAALAEEA